MNIDRSRLGRIVTSQSWKEVQGNKCENMKPNLLGKNNDNIDGSEGDELLRWFCAGGTAQDFL